MKPLYYNGEPVCTGTIRLKPDMRCHLEGWAGAIALGVGAATIGASVYSSTQQSNAQKAAANQAAQSQQNANNQNYQMFLQSRGSGGSAVLPMYLSNPNGSLFEGSLGNDLVNDYNASSVPLSSFTSATAPLSTAQTGATNLTNRLFTGGVTREMQRTAAPVEAARLSVARTSANDALSKTLAAIDAEQAGRGYSGDTLTNRLLQFQAQNTRGQQVGQANLQNLQEQADISNYGNITLPLQNINLPTTVAGNAAQLTYLPEAEWLNSINQRMQPLNFLRIGTSTPFTFQPLPVFNTGGGASAAVASGIGQGAGSLLGLYQQQQQNQNTQNLLQQLQNENLTNQYEFSTPGLGSTPAAALLAGEAAQGTLAQGTASLGGSAEMAALAGGE